MVLKLQFFFSLNQGRFEKIADLCSESQVTMKSKAKAVSLPVVSYTLLIALKVGVGKVSGSVSIISEAIHSTMDLLAVVIASLSVRISATPSDEQHPYGHDKIENISGIKEALLLFLAAFRIILSWKASGTENIFILTQLIKPEFHLNT